MRPWRMMTALIGLGSARALACLFRRLAEKILFLPEKSKGRFREGAKPGTRGACAPQIGVALSRGNSSAQIKHRHAHGQTVGHLVEDDTLAPIGHLAVYLHAPVDRARVHDQAILLEERGARLR